MKFLRFEDLWDYSEKTSFEEDLSLEDVHEKIIAALKQKEYGDFLYYFSIISKREDINIFTELQKSVSDHFVARQEDD